MDSIVSSSLPKLTKLPRIFPNQNIVDDETGEPIYILNQKIGLQEPKRGIRPQCTDFSEQDNDREQESVEIVQEDPKTRSLSPIQERTLRNALFDEFLRSGSVYSAGSSRSKSQDCLSVSSIDSGNSSVKGSKPGDSSVKSGNQSSSSKSISKSSVSTKRMLNDDERELRRCYFKELLESGEALVADPRWRVSEMHFPTRDHLIRACKAVAGLRARQVCYVREQLEDEDRREHRRQLRERQVAVQPNRLRVVSRSHEEERRKFHFYIEEVRHQNEVKLMTEMKRLGFLW